MTKSASEKHVTFALSLKLPDLNDDSNPRQLSVQGLKNTEDFQSLSIDDFHVDSAVCCLTICFYLIDYFLDFILLYKYYILQVNHPPFVIYFWLSLGFCLGSPLLGIIFELIWNSEEESTENTDGSFKALHIVQTLFSVLLLGPVFKFVLSIVYIRKSHSVNNNPKVTEHYKHRAEVERSQAAFLCVVEKFLESSLHLIHQMSLIRTEWLTEHRACIDWIEWLKVGICLFLMPYTLTVFASFRRVVERRTPMTIASGSVHFMWASLIVSSQAASMSLFATHQPLYFGAICIAHYILSVIYVTTLALPPGRSRILFISDSGDETITSKYLAIECFSRLVISYLFFFVFVHIKPMSDKNSDDVSNSTLYSAIIFYALMLIERALMMIIWNENCIRHGPTPILECHPTLVFFFVAFAAGLILMVIYYNNCHPTKLRRRQSQLMECRCPTGDIAVITVDNK